MAFGLGPALSVAPARTDRHPAPNAFSSERGGRSFCVDEIVGVTFGTLLKVPLGVSFAHF
jgi:hypothetical protein